MTNDFEAARLLKEREVCRVTAQARTTIYAKAKAGTFPRPIKIGVRASAWRAAEVWAWLANPMGWRAAAAAEAVMREAA